MCRISSIQMMIMVLTYFKSILGFIVFMIGVSFVNDINLHEAFTVQFREYGGGLIMLGMMSGLNVFPMKWATDRHNRFMLTFCFCIDLIVFASQIHLGQTVTSYTYPDFPSELQKDCLLLKPEIYSPLECQPYFNSDRVAGMRLYWQYYYTDRLQKSSFQKITSIEGDVCCGFFGPLRCKCSVVVCVYCSFCVLLFSAIYRNHYNYQ